MRVYCFVLQLLESVRKIRHALGERGSGILWQTIHSKKLFTKSVTRRRGVYLKIDF